MKTKNKMKARKFDLESDSNELLNAEKIKMIDKCTCTMDWDKTECINRDIGNPEESLIINFSLTL